MSQRLPVDRERIAEFLRRLGEQFRGAGRIYLVGGTTVVYESLRAQTLEIDLALDVEPEAESRLIQTIRELKDRLSINVEQVSPADFIPLPKGHKERSEYVGRFGDLDVFHFDLYSTALSKIERGNEQNFSDVIALLQHGRIAWPRLQACFDEILPQFGEHGLKQDPDEFRRKFDALRAKWPGDAQQIGDP